MNLTCETLVGFFALTVVDAHPLTSTGAIVSTSLIVFFVLLNAFFVASEFAIVKVRGSQIDAEIEAGNRRAVAARDILDHLDAYLSVNQLGITLASIALGALGEPFIFRAVSPLFVSLPDSLAHGISFGISYSVVTYLHVVMGELIPKSIAIRYSLATTLMVARPLKMFYWGMRPIIWLLNGNANAIMRHGLRLKPATEKENAHSGEELRMIVSASEEQAEVTSMEKDILLNALELNDYSARDIMTPRSDVVTLDVKDSFAANIALARSTGHTRFPLVNGHIDDALGFIHIKDLFLASDKPETPIETLQRPLMAVPESIPLDKLLRFFLDRQAHMALVVDEFGGTVGIVTLDNVMEELVGEIKDEFDAKSVGHEITKVSDHEFRCPGALGLYELGEYIDENFSDADATTVGGHVTDLFGQLPQEGDAVEVGEWKAVILKSDGRRVLQVLFVKGQAETDFAESEKAAKLEKQQD